MSLTRVLIEPVGVLLGGSMMSFLTARYWSQRSDGVTERGRNDANHAANLLRITALEAQLALVSQSVVPISTAFQTMLVKQLTHSHTPRLDDLLLKIGPPNKLTAEEEEEFNALLLERSKDPGPLITESERNSATVLQGVMKIAGFEHAAMNGVALQSKLVRTDGALSVVGMPPLLDK